MTIETLPDGTQILARTRKSINAEIRVTRSHWRGADRIDLRVWSLPAQGVTMFPSRKGIMVDARRVPELIEVLLAAVVAGVTDPQARAATAAVAQRAALELGAVPAAEPGPPQPQTWFSALPTAPDP